MISRTVLLTDGREFVCDIIVADLITFERHYDLDATLASGRLEHWAFLCWAVVNRDGRFTGSFDEWIPMVADINVVEAEEVPKDAASLLEDSPVP